MENRFDDLTKALAEGIPRRQALRRLAGLFSGALVGALTFGATATANECGQHNVACVTKKCCKGYFCCSITNACCPDGWTCLPGCPCVGPGITCGL
jgi:hypothetical protein